MLDTLYIGLDEEIPIDFLEGIPANEAFSPPQMPGWTGRLETTKPSSYYSKHLGAKFMLKLRHHETGVTITGPVFYDKDYWLCATIRANIPRLAGLPDVWLPENDREIQTAITKLEQLLTWLPDSWKLRAKIKELHLTMNFEFTGPMSAQDVMGAHQLMRHKRVRPDPLKFKPSHKTLYWRGKDTVIALYEKTTEACSRLAKERNTTVDEIRKRYHLDELLRLEFRLKTPALIKLLDRVLPAPPVPADGPPLPKSASSNLPLSILTKDISQSLFGFAAKHVETPPPGGGVIAAEPKDCSGWWVRKSARQIIDRSGMPKGFRHQLMHGRKIIQSGVGTDANRTFRAQADFLNKEGRS